MLAPLLDQVHLMTFDFRTPERSPQEADYPAPLYYVHDRKSYQNVDATVRRWLEHGTDGTELEEPQWSKMHRKPRILLTFF